MPTHARRREGRSSTPAILYGPGKAANAGGVATSGLEMSQNSMRLVVDARGGRRPAARDHDRRSTRAASRPRSEYGTPGNYVNGANIAGFLKVGERDAGPGARLEPSRAATDQHAMTERRAIAAAGAQQSVPGVPGPDALPGPGHPAGLEPLRLVHAAGGRAAQRADPRRVPRAVAAPHAGAHPRVERRRGAGAREGRAALQPHHHHAPPRRHGRGAARARGRERRGSTCRSCCSPTTTTSSRQFVAHARPRRLSSDIFLWQGDARILLAIVKYVEDARNVAHDTAAVGVRVILVVEDNVRYYSSFLPDDLHRADSTSRSG